MGKYMKKPKLTGEVSLTEVSTIGVRTRAKSLALQRLQNAKSPSSHGGAAFELDASSFCYLQLRSRRLEKCLPPVSAKKKEISKECRNPNLSLKVSSVSVEKKSEAVEIEASCGENSLDFEDRDRGVRESTPCSFVGGAESIGTPASATVLPSSAATYRSHVQQRCITPTMEEIEEFFSTVEQQDQRLFIEKYNFDVVNDMPLSGRYEWVQVAP